MLEVMAYGPQPSNYIDRLQIDYWHSLILPLYINLYVFLS
jgi:hypothetical protein